MQPKRATIGAVAVLVVATAAGCSEELGPERPPTTRVEGSITVGGRPVVSGWIEFLPVEGTTGNLRTTRIEKDGSFAADLVPVGKVAVAFADLPVASIPTALGPVSSGSFRFFTTTIRRTIPPGPSSRLGIDLAAEAYVYRKARQELGRALVD